MVSDYKRRKEALTAHWAQLRLTTSRASYHIGLSEGTAGDDRAYLRGAACRPIQQHPLPYGRECDFVIGDKISVYRGDYCTSPSMQRTIGAGHAPGSPRLVSVHSPSALLQKVQQEQALLRTTPPWRAPRGGRLQSVHGVAAGGREGGASG